MIAAVINAVLVILGGAAGLVFKRWISDRLSSVIFTALGLCVLLIGVSGAIKTDNVLCVIICMVIGTVAGETLKIEQRIDALGETLKAKVMRGKDSGRFTEGFMSATLLFCVGAMAIMGSIEAGINHNYSIIISKSVIDCVTAVTFASAMGIGVLFSGFAVLIYQGAITLLAMWIGPLLPSVVINEMSAVGSLLIIGLALNMLGANGGSKIRVGNMLPAMFLPIAYIPFTELLGRIFS